MVNNILPILSNVFFLGPAFQAAEYMIWPLVVVYLAMMFVSGAHHLCVAFSACAFSPVFHQKMDFFFAQWLMVIAAIYLIRMPLRWASSLAMVIGLAIVIMEYVFDEPFFLQLMIGGVAALLLGTYWGWCLTVESRFPRYHTLNLLKGLLLSALACSLFATQKSWPSGYDYVHSVWHAVAAMGQVFILRAVPHKKIYV